MDDVRQDCLCLQVIKIFEEIFRNNDLDVYLYSYKTIPNRTGQVTSFYILQIIIRIMILEG
jgi:hypothetical protein